MKKTLGGDRLGSGRKMKVELHGYERSTHDLGYLWRSTMSAGTLVPFLCEIGLPGDTFDIDLDVDIKTHPTVGPLFGSYKVQGDIFLAPIRLYQGLLHNNRLDIGRNMSVVKLPQIELTGSGITTIPEDLDNSQINPSCILSYIGIRGVGNGESTRLFNATAIITYWDIYKNYYANKQEEIGAVIHTPAVALITTVTSINITQPDSSSGTLPVDPGSDALPLQSGTIIEVAFTGAQPLLEQIMVLTQNNSYKSMLELSPSMFLISPGVLAGQFQFSQWGNDVAINWRYRDVSDLNNGKPAVVTFPLENLDNMRTALQTLISETTPFVIDALTSEPPYQWLCEQPNGVPNSLSSQEGLALKTYQSDLFNNWLSTEWIDGPTGINAITAIDTSGGSFTLDTLNLSKKVYDMLNRIAVSGGTYYDWLDAVYTHARYDRCETPIYVGGIIKEVVFQEVVSQSEGSEGGQPLGTLAGKGIMAKKNKGGRVTIRIDEPSYIMGIISLTPRIDYSQGNKWDVNLETLDDLHKPALDEIGFEELITERMAWWDTEFVGAEWVQKSAGKQPAWINYMTNVNRVYGNFAIESNEMFMTLNRRYEPNSGVPTLTIADLTTYIDPSKFNFIFANTALDAQNFWAQIAVDITARRKMSAKIMPNL